MSAEYVSEDLTGWGGVLGRALANLDDVERTVLTLSYFTGLSHDLIAHHTGLPRPAVTKLIARAMHNLADFVLETDSPRTANG